MGLADGVVGRGQNRRVNTPESAAPKAQDPAPSAALRRTQVQRHARVLLPVSTAALAAGGLAQWSLQGLMQPLHQGLWLAALAVVMALRGWLCGPLRGLHHATPVDAGRQLHRLWLLTLVHGSLWGVLAWLVPLPVSPDALAALVLVLGGVVVMAMLVAQYDPVAAAAFVLPALLSMVAWLAIRVDHWPRYVAVAAAMLLMLGAAMWLAARASHRSRRELMAARIVDAEQIRRTQDAEALLRRVFDHVGEGLCMFDAQQRLVAWNARMVELMGIDPPQAHVGAPLRELLLDMARRGEFGTGDAQTEVDRRLQAMTRADVGISQRQRPDGSMVEVRRSDMPDGGFTLVAVDITERRRSEQALQHNRGMLALLLQSTEEGVWFIDNQQLTTDANPAMCRLLGVPLEALIGRSIYEFVDAENEVIFRQQVARRAQGLTGSYEVALRRSDGTRVHCQNNSTPLLDAQGVKVGAVGLFSDISALKQAAAELQHTSALLAAKTRVLESTLQSLSQGVLSIGPDGRVEAWNRRLLELTEVPEPVLQQQPTLRAMVDWQLAHGLLSAGGDDDAWLEEARRFATGDDSVLWDSPHYQRQRSDGTVIDVQLHHATDGTQVRTYTDVTESARAQRALQASESRFRTMADAAPAFIWQCDAQGQVVWFNQRWLRLIGRTLAQAVAESWNTRIHPQDLPRCRSTFEQAWGRAAPFEIEYRVATADGSEVWLADSGIPHLDGEGRLDGYVTYGWDTTARKAAERNLIAARDEAERANQAKSAFLSRMSHELRTPLNAVLGFAQLIDRDTDEPPRPMQRERVQQILRGGAHLLVLINEVLDLARIEAGAVPMNVEAVDLDALLPECRQLVEATARQQGVQLDLALPPQGLGRVVTDATRLRQVLLNLLSNAIKYNRAGGRVCLSGQTDGPCVTLSVSDTGPGLSPAQQARLFQAFERLDADRGPVEGTGIGLALSKALVDLMGGRIGVRSRPGSGSTFWVELPRGEVSTLTAVLATATTPAADLAPFERAGGADPSSLPVAAPSADRWQVLYIEDNAVNQIVVESMLKQLPQVSLTLAAEPEQGLAMVLARPPDLVLLDIQLPFMSGFEVLRRLRADPATRHVPVIAVSANAMPEDLARAREAGFDDYVTKPLQLERLLGAVRALLPPR